MKIWLLGLWLLFVGNAAAVEYSTVKIENVPVTICRVDLRKERLQLFHRDDKGQPFKRFSPLASWLEERGEKLIFAMNAGMYHGDFSAVGLFVAEGKQLVPLNTDDAEGNFFLKPNGVFAVTEKGGAVVETSDYPKLKEKVLLATQSGPLLVHRGKIHPAFKPTSDSRLFRNGVGVNSAHEVIFANSEAPLNLHEFARLFLDKLDCPNALFFDGTVSSLFSTELKRNDFRIDLGPMIGVTVPLK
ncbi:MAG TPA: phosphodiester glycosidase family protein [Chthoniobacterales bacterium]|jgi:uncharacterized protein YigE (DUF2233 family)